MKQTDEIDEYAKLLLIAGDEEEVRQGLRLAAETFQVPVHAFLKRKFCGITADERMDAWQETFRHLACAALARTLKVEGKLSSWLCTVAKCRFLDHLRARKRRPLSMEDLGAPLRDTRTGEAWARLAESERSTVERLVAEQIRDLPPQQQLVLSVYVNGLPETDDHEELRRQINTRAGTEVTMAAVKRALQEGREKMRAALARHGYGPLGGRR